MSFNLIATFISLFDGSSSRGINFPVVENIIFKMIVNICVQFGIWFCGGFICNLGRGQLSTFKLDLGDRQ